MYLKLLFSSLRHTNYWSWVWKNWCISCLCHFFVSPFLQKSEPTVSPYIHWLSKLIWHHRIIIKQKWLHIESFLKLVNVVRAKHPLDLSILPIQGHVKYCPLCSHSTPSNILEEHCYLSFMAKVLYLPYSCSTRKWLVFSVILLAMWLPLILELLSSPKAVPRTGPPLSPVVCHQCWCSLGQFPNGASLVPFIG